MIEQTQLLPPGGAMQIAASGAYEMAASGGHDSLCCWWCSQGVIVNRTLFCKGVVDLLPTLGLHAFVV